MVQTTPHGEGDVRDHINTEYDTDEDGRIENSEVDGLVNLAAADAFSTYPLASGDIAADAITAAKILAGAVGRSELATLSAFDMSPTDLTTSALDPASEGVYAHHDGSGAISAGLYRSDPVNNQWVKVEDNTVTIAY